MSDTLAIEYERMQHRRSRNRRIMIAVVLFALALLVLTGWQTATSWKPARSDYPFQGPIAGAEQGEIRWQTVAAMGANFAYVRATDGSDKRDSRFLANVEGIREAGIRYGAVHHYNLCQLASEQATNFVTAVPRDANALPTAIELSFDEECKDRPGRSLLVSELETFINQVENHMGKRALLRISRDFEDSYEISSGIDRTVWLVGDYFPPDYATQPWVMWQANSHYRTRGAEGPLSWNVMRPK